MSATRTQIYLSAEQRQAVDRLAEAEGVTMAEVIRRALSAYLAKASPDPTTSLAATFGAASDAHVPSRNEWDRG